MKKEELGKKLFTYGVITDTHINHSERESNSEYKINLRANGRLRHVIMELNKMELAFVIHLGDIVHPVPARSELYEMAAKCFREQVAELNHDLYLTPGNHDIGDKPINWGLGGVACEDYVKLWKKNFGRNYQSFKYQNCKFILFDTQIINTGLKVEREQKGWLEKEMEAAFSAGQRLFLNAHYPLFLNNADEDEHFDNLANPGRSWLLNLMEYYGVEAQFSGHVHNFWFNRFGITNCYALPSTAFVRQDYAEIYRVNPLPGTEGGRSDLAKLGYFVVHVHESGHVCQWVRTFGSILEPEQKSPQSQVSFLPIHPLQNPHSNFGFDMRQNWLEIVEIPPSGSLDEFDRKRIRNDYALMSLIETGVRRVRIPFTDLLDPEHLARLFECANLGLKYTLFSYGVPDNRLLQILLESKGLIDMWEICDVAEKLNDTVNEVRSTVKEAGISLFLSTIRTKEDQEKATGKYHHMIVHGFSPLDKEMITQIANIDDVSGIVFRIDGETSPWLAVQSVFDLIQKHGLKASLHIRMSKGSPGMEQTDDHWYACRLAEAVFASFVSENIYLYADTFADVDRGYYRRHGVVDRFYNPRPAFEVLRQLTTILANVPSFLENQDSEKIYLLGTNGKYYELVFENFFKDSFNNHLSKRLLDLYRGENIPIKSRKIKKIDKSNKTFLGLLELDAKDLKIN